MLTERHVINNGDWLDVEEENLTWTLCGENEEMLIDFIYLNLKE